MEWILIGLLYNEIFVDINLQIVIKFLLGLVCL